MEKDSLHNTEVPENCEVSNNCNVIDESKLHKLNRKWTLWAHLPHDTKWDEDSYKQIYTFESLESVVELIKILPDALIKNCMLFIMKDGVKPMWEDKENRDGGCFYYKISNKIVISSWKKFVYKMVCENVIDDNKKMLKVNGITISPKRNFCIIKLWLKDCTIQNPKCIAEIEGSPHKGCLFKRHNPEY